MPDVEEDRSPAPPAPRSFMVILKKQAMPAAGAAPEPVRPRQRPKKERAMKKQRKLRKLPLNRETLHHLEAHESAQVAAAGLSMVCTPNCSGHDSCFTCFQGTSCIV